MPKSIVSILNQPIKYFESTDDNCKCGDVGQCILVQSNQQIYSQLQILPCGEFELCNNSLGDQLACNGEFNLGDELTTNGSFNGDASGWTVGANWAYGTNNVCATSADVGETISQTLSITNGKYYRVQYTIKNYSAGDIRAELGGTNGVSRSADGMYTEFIMAGAGTDIVFDNITTDFTGCITDVSVRLLDCWEMADWTWTAGKLCADVTSSDLVQDIPAITNGITYQLIFTVSDYTSGDFTPHVGGVDGTVVNANGTYTQYITSNGGDTLLRFTIAGTFVGCIDDVSLKAVEACWDADETDWTSTSIGACHVAGNTTDLENSTPVTSGQYYHVTIVVSSSTAGGVNVVLGSNVISPQTSGNGTFHFWGVANATQLIVRPTSDFDGCISGLEVDEYCNDYKFHLIPASGDEFIVVDLTPYYTLKKDIYNLNNFIFSDLLIADAMVGKVLPIPYGCYKICLVDCCTEQQTATSLLRNYNFASGGLYWTYQNVTIGFGFANFLSGFASNFIQQALITTHDADCIEVQFQYACESLLNEQVNIYINGHLLNETLINGGGNFSASFSNVPAGAIIKIEMLNLNGDVHVDNVIVTVPEECQPVYDQCTPCIKFQPTFSCVKLVEGWCNGNALGFEFDDANGNNQFKLSQLARAELLHPTYEQEQEDYDYSTGTTSLSFGQNKKFQSLTFAPIPEYKHDVISLQKICDNFQIDTADYFVKKGDYTPEWNRSTNTDLAPSRIEVKKKDQTLFNNNCG